MDVNELAQMVFPGLCPLVMEDVADDGERIVVRARTPLDTAVCQVCGASSGRHGYHWRRVADVPVDWRRVVVRVWVRRLVCPTRGCRHTFREQVPGVLERYQRRTARLTRQVMAVVKESAGRAGSRLLAILAVVLSRHTALRALLRIPLPAGGRSTPTASTCANAGPRTPPSPSSTSSKRSRPSATRAASTSCTSTSAKDCTCCCACAHGPSAASAGSSAGGRPGRHDRSPW